jgi:iron complex transport system substrate-binding protein
MKKQQNLASTPKRTALAPVIAVALAIALLAMPLAGCNSAQPTQKQLSDAAVTFTDDLGSEITVDKPQRVVATLSSFAQTWQLAGGTNLVGLTDDAKTEGNVELPADVQYVGNYDSLNLEAIIALKPDFVILTGAARYKQTDLQEALKSSNINAAYFNVTHFEDYLRLLKTLTDITGRADLYEANGAAVQTKINDITAKVPAAKDGKQPSALFFITESGGARVQNGATMPGRVLVDLGCTNVADTTPSLLSEFSIEGLIEADPDYIFVLPMGNSPDATAANIATLESNPAWENIPAVKKGNYIKVDQEHFLYKPNNHWDESYKIIFDALYSK